MHIEDFSGKADFAMFGEDYVKYSNYLDKGTIVMLEGAFKQRYNSDTYEFKISRLNLLETVKPMLTKEVRIEVEPENVNDHFINFIDSNVQSHPGKTTLKFCIKDPVEKWKIGLYTLEKSFTMNDDMASYLNSRDDFDITVLTA